ncbi:MAG: sulfotransferase [Proteobacteria bacterium]|nr:sulfotransferase [Pseudomonadota bacterium]
MMPALAEREALLQQAQALRAKGQLTDALAVLARIEAAEPRFSRLHQERGQCHVLRRDAAAAVQSLEEAVRLNPTLPASWDMLAQLYRMCGDAPRADAAARRLAVLRQLPVEIVAASSLHADGDWDKAEAILRDYLRGQGNNAGALRLLARIRLDRDDPAAAEPLLRAALDLAPDWHEARLDYAMALLQQQKHQRARDEAVRLLAHAPAHRDYRKQYAAACVGLGDHAPVIDLYADLLADTAPTGPEAAELRLWRANALKAEGRTPDAIAEYRAAIAAGDEGTGGVAWFSLANLKTYRFSDDEIDRMRRAEAGADIPAMERVYLAFALGKALEDRGDHAAAWRCYQQGNALRRPLGRYRPEVAESCVARQAVVFTPDFFAARTGWGLVDPAPIFVIGMPRSGSTLIEQILASHRQVEGTHELTEIGRLAAEISGADPDCGLPVEPEALARLTARQARALGERFLTETRVYRRAGRPFFIDKMPNNFWHVGLIHLMLPRATIIDVRRAPMACCFGNLKQLFGTTHHEFAYGIDDVARHYRAYLAQMRHWDAVLPGRVLRVHHEDVVTDLEGTVRRLLAHTGLPFDPACLAFHENPRSVRTPSSEQVRRPIDAAAIDQWRAYAGWLEPLERALGPALTTYRT